jgi:hypothetical protein
VAAFSVGFKFLNSPYPEIISFYGITAAALGIEPKETIDLCAMKGLVFTFEPSFLKIELPGWNEACPFVFFGLIPSDFLRLCIDPKILRFRVLGTGIFY